MLKLLKMGVIKPRPSGEVATVRLTERASLQGVAPHPTKNLFSKRFLELQKLLEMGVVYPPSHDEFTFPPLRRCAVFVSPPPRRRRRLPIKTTP